MKKKYLDSNIFLNPILYDDEKARKCLKILKEIISGKFVCMTSLLTWDEVVYVTGKILGKDIALNEGSNFIKYPNLIFVNVNIDVILNAQKIVEKYGLKPRDAIHAATALSQGCSEIVSEDSDFDKVKEIKRVNV